MIDIYYIPTVWQLKLKLLKQLPGKRVSIRYMRKPETI